MKRKRPHDSGMEDPSAVDGAVVNLEMPARSMAGRAVARHAHIGSPRALHSLLEPRALIEMALLPAALPLLLQAPRGDGHPVLLLPGFLADEKSLIALKLFLQSKGYELNTWGLGRNLGFRSKHASALPQEIRYLHSVTGRKVSLAGVFSLYGAESTLDCVRSIITLGSPVSVDTADSQSPPTACGATSICRASCRTTAWSLLRRLQRAVRVTRRVTRRDKTGPASFSWVRVALGTDILDPVLRLKKIQTTSSSSTVMAQAVSAHELTNLAQRAPSAAIAVASKMLRSASALLGDWTPLANCAITNVPGPQVPLYLHGARLTYLSAIMPIADGMGLVFSVTSYNDMIIISFTACYEQLPDPEVFAQCLRDSFQEYLVLARPAARRKARPAAARRKVALPGPKATRRKTTARTAEL